MQAENNIQSVLVRVDFAPIDSLKAGLPKAVRDSISPQFPRTEFQEINSNNVELSSTGAVLSSITEKIHEWHFFDSQDSRHIVITPSSVFLEVKKEGYISFEMFMSSFQLVTSAFQQEYKDCNITRIGLRYINVIQNYGYDTINDQYLQEIHDVKESERVKIITSIETKTDSHRMRVQYGLVNPDYPSVDVKKEYVIDLDAYCEGLYYLSELEEILRELHNDIEDKYLKFLKVGDDKR